MRFLLNGVAVPLLKISPDRQLYIGTLQASKNYTYSGCTATLTYYHVTGCTGSCGVIQTIPGGGGDYTTQNYCMNCGAVLKNSRCITCGSTNFDTI